MRQYQNKLQYLENIYQKIKNGYQISFEEAIFIVEKYDADDILKYAGQICDYFNNKKAELCSIVNAKSGACSENCRFCAQSLHNKTNIKIYGLIDKDQVLRYIEYCLSNGVNKISLVTSGRKLERHDFIKLLEIYKCLCVFKHLHICASHGELTFEMAKALKHSGVKTYHHNLETSSNFFKQICTTHSFEDRILTIKNCIKAKLEVCSGGIIGMGETREDRIRMFIELRQLGVKSIPINILTPIKGTPLESMMPLEKDEIIKMFGICRMINAQSTIRFAGGRSVLDRNVQLQLLKGGVNAAITGDLLTTCGISIQEDKALFKEAGLTILN